MNKSFIYYKENSKYPEDIYFRPSTAYPEYQYPGLGFSKEQNDVYEMMRNMFISLELDKEHIGKSDWNPLSSYINENDTVLIKPNFVKHYNETIKGKKGLECLITHPSIIRCVIDYVLIALKGTGKIIIADAPVQSCDFEKLKIEAGLVKLEEFYKEAGQNIKFEDLRNYKSERVDGHVINVPLDFKYKGKVVNLGKHSYFYNNTTGKKLRITNYDYRELNKHHNGIKQEYCISEACLQADVIINLPKPKTHRKAGYTGALKNMVGINARKEFLPHHTKGSYLSGNGDEYYSSSYNAQVKSNINDITDILDKKALYKAGDFIRKTGELFLKNTSQDEKYSEGSWWGNKTIWKTILDLNTIVMYADKNGHLKNEPQRKVITIGDMLTAGEKEGPLCPPPKETGILLFADNSVLFDKILVRLMGFQEEKFILLKEAGKNKKLSLRKFDDHIVSSNFTGFEAELTKLNSKYKFMPSSGWREYLN